MLRFVFAFAFVLLSVIMFSQTGKIIGTITDAKTGETLPGATAVIEGTTKGASADFDGKFSINNLAAGKYNLVISYISYTTKKIAGVDVKEGDVTNVNVLLEPSTSQELQEVEVVVTLNKENNTALVLQQKNNASVSDGVSAETIKRTPDRNTSDVIKRVSGATIQDNKFAIIRGMNDRYVSAYLNGAPLPSSETDRKAFSFDIFPANLLDNIVILKTATPDLPADFAGGIIQINTKSIPDKNYYNVALGVGYNSQTTFKDFVTYKGGKTDWLGIDDGTRALPEGIPDTKTISEATNLEKVDYAKMVNYDWSLQRKIALPNLNFQYAMANVGKIFGNEAGSVFAITYNNTNNTVFNDRREFEEQGDTAQKIRGFKDTIFNNNILTSALWNLAYKITPNNQISVKNILSVNSDDKVGIRNGLFDGTGPAWERSSIRWFTQNRVYSGQLTGDHFIKAAKLKIKWIGGYSDIVRNIPNLRKMVYQKTSARAEDSVKYYGLVFENTVYPNSAGSMFFANNNESIKSIRYDISRDFEIAKTKHDLKIGGFHQTREREFKARLLGYTKFRRGSQILFNDSLAGLPEGQMFAAQNMGIIDGPEKYDGGFKLTDATINTDAYNAKSQLHAGYIMLDSRFGEKFRCIYGVRAESYYQQVVIKDPTDVEVKKDTINLDILPSINAVYSLSDKINIRAAYYKTVARPEFRELAEFNFYDFITDFSLSGNSSLVRSIIDNYDVRFEWFPGSGQLFSVSGFYKNIEQPIEQVSNTSSQIRALLYQNAERATNIGAELEYRIKLSTLFGSDSSKILNSTTLFSNFAYIDSKVKIGSTLVGSEAEVRPLQGQSPYIINAGAQYLDTDKGWGVSASYNLVGRRIFIVGSVDEPTYWENPRHVLDFQLVKTFKERLEVKVNLRDVLAQDFIFYQDFNKNGKLDKISKDENEKLQHDKKSDNIMLSSKVAPTISFSINWRF